MDPLSALPHRSLNDAIKLTIFNTVKQIKTGMKLNNTVTFELVLESKKKKILLLKTVYCIAPQRKRTKY